MEVFYIVITCVFIVLLLAAIIMWIVDGRIKSGNTQVPKLWPTDTSGSGNWGANPWFAHNPRQVTVNFADGHAGTASAGEFNEKYNTGTIVFLD